MFFVRRLYAMPSATAVLDELSAASAQQLGSNAWIEAKDAAAVPHLVELGVGEIKVRTYTPDRIVLDVSAPGDAFMVLSMAWSPYWKARVDGTARPIVRADHALMGLPVEPGDRAIVLTYEPPHRFLAILNGVFRPDRESGRQANHTELGTLPTDPICAQKTGA